MGHFQSNHVSSDQILIQRAEAGSRKTVQVGRDYTQTIRFNLWISLICILIFAATASVIVSLFETKNLPAEMPLEEIVIMDLFTD